MRKRLCHWFVVAVSLLVVVGVAFPHEIEIGKAVVLNGMEIEAVYEQPVTLEPMRGMGPPRDKAEIHLEAEIKAVRGNRWGFEAGSWVPYLTILYRWTKVGSGETGWGTFKPMVGPEGPHYGANARLEGAGKYRLTYRVEPPSLARHAGDEEGMPAWFEPFEASWEFTFKGFGKK
ncbi:iron transporter [Nitrospinae bacterium AH_259_B05_G02_I21]|nr:iron transporter [Nitrospinae bacterium AH_259_B05_G02_I21]